MLILHKCKSLKKIFLAIFQIKKIILDTTANWILDLLIQPRYFNLDQGSSKCGLRSGSEPWFGSNNDNFTVCTF